ncbi:MAG: 16S rRNA (uracil(1498)-N(3))-methyltransferase [Alistipes sp.]|nr:16S rRNA (uracil(1498)-N(3))-methyltransferase [Alistipes sp.]MBO7307818.1 16S rRNA (uracil(1498)-N(3))-methyltransferase [Alistipes sp.]
MQLFYAPEITLPRYTLSEEESKHCIRVLRMGCGDELHITDGRGAMHRCKIVDDNVKRCTVEVIDTIHEFEKLPYNLTVAIAPTKNIDRLEWFLEKATEVGISEIYPLLCEHSERKEIKHEREERVITSAVKQSLKAYHPTLHPMTTFRQLVAMPFDGDKFIAHCNSEFGNREYLGKLIKKGGNTLILIGPEGDFSPEEIIFAEQNGFKAISLGKERLRTETAALVATVVTATINKL